METERLKPLFVIGPAGCGKSRYIQQLADREGRTLLRCPCRKDRTLREQRTVIHEWALRAEPTLLWIEGADDLTPEAQSFLRRILETYALRVRFCLEARTLESIQEPILSRCEILRLPARAEAELVGDFSRTYSADLIAKVKPQLVSHTHRQYDTAICVARHFPELWSHKEKYTVHADLHTEELMWMYADAVNPWVSIWSKFDTYSQEDQELVAHAHLIAANPWAIIGYLQASAQLAR
jgi:hypothetical protein